MGLLLMDPSDQADFPIGARLRGSLNLHRAKYPVNAVVRHSRADRVGCQWVHLTEPVQQVIAQFLEPHVLGMDLKPIPSPLPSVDSNIFWFQGPVGTSFVVKRQMDGQCVSLLLSVCSQFVHWEKATGLMTGHTELSESVPEKREWEGILCHETLLFHPDLNPDQKKLSVAKKLILSSNLSTELKTWCGRYFRFDCVG
jgi:hypothetical protein